MKNKVEYHVGTFVDYAGVERKFVMAAVSSKPEFRDDIKYLSVGVSVCRPCDEFDEELGKQIAYGKALESYEHRILAFDNGYINRDVALAVLKTAVKHFTENPGRYLAGYDSDAIKYAKQKQLDEYVANLSEEHKEALNVITGMEDEELERFTEVANHLRLG